jgi:prefoldin subunit 5
LEESNWQNKLTFGIQNFQRNLEDSKVHIGNNSKVREAYQEALEAVAKARESISRFVGTFNQEYSGKPF